MRWPSLKPGFLFWVFSCKQSSETKSRMEGWWGWGSSRDQPEKPTKNLSGNIKQHSGAFLLTELFERANQIVACPITPVASLALVRMLIGDNWSHLEARTSIYGQHPLHSNPADVCKSPRIPPYFTRWISHRLYPVGHKTTLIQNQLVTKYGIPLRT